MGAERRGMAQEFRLTICKEGEQIVCCSGIWGCGAREQLLVLGNEETASRVVLAVGRRIRSCVVCGLSLANSGAVEIGLYQGLQAFFIGQYSHRVVPMKNC